MDVLMIDWLPLPSDEVLRTDGDKEMLEMEALSLIILELNYSTPKPEHVQVLQVTALERSIWRTKFNATIFPRKKN
jgi:hypothetical protein